VISCEEGTPCHNSGPNISFQKSTIGTNLSRPVPTSRSGRRELHRRIRKLTTRSTLKQCGSAKVALDPRRRTAELWCAHDDLAVHGGTSGSMKFAGLQRCSSRIGCMHCSARVALESAAEVSAVVDQHLSSHAGAGVLFLTATLPHHFNDPLRDTLDTVLKSWTALRSGRAVKKQLQQYGYRGYIRALDLTFSGNAGWHPHIHALILLDHQVEHVRPLEEALYKVWNAAVQRRGLKPVSRARFRLEVPRDDTRVSHYISEISGATKVAAVAWELSTGGKVESRGPRGWRKGVTPHELYVRMAWGEDWARRAVHELEGAMYRRKWLTWSKYAQELRAQVEPLELPEEEPNVPDVYIPVWFYQNLREIPRGFDQLESALRVGRTKLITNDHADRLVTYYETRSPGWELQMTFRHLWDDCQCGAGVAQVPHGQFAMTEFVMKKLLPMVEAWYEHGIDYRCAGDGAEDDGNRVDS
jgi:hypothetical protein